MKLRCILASPAHGSALVMVLVLSAVTLLILGSALQWSSTNTTLSQRNNEYYRTVAAAEASTEKVITRISSDYQKNGDALVMANISSYRGAVPTNAEDVLLGNYQFSDGQGGLGRNYVEFIPPTQYRVLKAQYRGLYGWASQFRIISNARDTASRFNITAAVWQEVETATIPLFQFAIFYNLDLEINPGPIMTVTGPVHGNRSIYLQPQNVLTFQGDVTSAREIINNKKPGDPLVRSGGSIVFQNEHDSGVSTLNLPIGTDNSPASVHQVVELPPLLESPASPLGQQRFYNKADMIINLTGPAFSPSVTVTSGRYDSFATIIPIAEWDFFADVGTTFHNRRENKTVSSIDIDVAKLGTWNATNRTLRNVINRDVAIIYVNDQRTFPSSAEAGVRLRNGSLLPSAAGLTVATADPIYVWGDYNTRDATGTSAGADTTHTRPAALIGDAITVLSPAWNDANSNGNMASRVASKTTVNAAFLGGIVETTSGNYSGGVENFPRFLEDWSGKVFTYNGSMVVMYESRIAVGQWQGTGSSIGIYNPPNRNWAFDLNFRDPTKLPPGTPSVRALVRGSWAMIKPNTTTVW